MKHWHVMNSVEPKTRNASGPQIFSWWMTNFKPIKKQLMFYSSFLFTQKHQKVHEKTAEVEANEITIINILVMKTTQGHLKVHKGQKQLIIVSIITHNPPVSTVPCMLRWSSSPLSLFFAPYSAHMKHGAVASDNSVEVPLMCSGTAGLQSVADVLSGAFCRCLARSFRAPGEITVPRVHRAVVMLPVFPTVAFFNLFLKK